MKFTYDDGGRRAAGYRGDAGDCVTRAVAIATGLPYQQVYDAMAEGNAGSRLTKRTKRSSVRRSASNGVLVKRQWFKRYMQALGWRWTPTMGIGTGCTVHLADGELPAGRLIVSVSRHYVAVIDGVIHDTFDPSDRGTTIYPLGTSKDELPKKATLHPDGGSYLYSPNRCVYGYWSRA